jgi:ferredoxin-NADP reductase
VSGRRQGLIVVFLFGQKLEHRADRAVTKAEDYPLRLRLADIRVLTPRISALRLCAADAGRLPGFAPGAHLRFPLALDTGQVAVRAYSLLNPGDAPQDYEIAVQLEPAGHGGSRFMHGLSVGDELACSLPANDFALCADGGRHVLIAGGIGVTPLLAMARHLSASGADFEFHYVARTPEMMAFRAEVAAFATAKLLFDAGDPARGLDLSGIFKANAPGTHFYICGPQKMVEDAAQIHARTGLPQASFHYELFAGTLGRPGDAAFDVVLARDGRRFTIPRGTTILDVLIEAGLDPNYDCRRGECGICVVTVCAGMPDHRDVTLSEQEKASGKSMCTCISRALSPELVLDL